MARSYANIVTAIWNDPDFRSLDPAEQHAFLLLCTQPNISAAGTLPLTLRRWAAMSRGQTVEALRGALAGLRRDRFIVLDEDTEELLVRRFVFYDKGYSNPKRRPAILDAARETASAALRGALAVELARVGLPTGDLGAPPPDGPRGGGLPIDSQSKGIPPEPVEPMAEAVEDPREADIPPELDESAVDIEEPQVNSLSIANPLPTDCLSAEERIVVSHRTYVGSSTHNPHLSSRTPAATRPAADPLAQTVAEATGADDDETREVIDQIRKTHRPRNLAGYVRTMASNGDLAGVLDDVRQQRARRAESERRRAELEMLDQAEDHATPAQGEAARAEAHAAARSALAGLRAGMRGDRGREHRPPGEPTPLGAIARLA